MFTAATDQQNANLAASTTGNIDHQEILDDLKQAAAAGNRRKVQKLIAQIESIFQQPADEAKEEKEEEARETEINNQVHVYAAQALYAAAENGHLQVMEWLTKRFPGALNDIALACGKALLLATENGHLEVMQYLLMNDFALINETEPDGDHNSVLGIAIEKGHAHLVAWILENAELLTAKIESKPDLSILLGHINTNDHSSLEIASLQANLQTFKLLIAKYRNWLKDDIRKLRDWTQPAFYIAMESEEDPRPLMQYLLETGLASISDKDSKTQKTTLEYAVELADDRVVTFLSTFQIHYLLLPDLAGACIYTIACPPLKSSGDIYHIIAYLILALEVNTELPQVILGYDDPCTELQARRGAGLAQLLGFESKVIPTELVKSTRPNARQADVRQHLADSPKAEYLVDQKATTAMISLFVQKYGFTVTTGILRKGFLALDYWMSQKYRNVFAQVDQWVDEEWEKIKRFAADKPIVIFNNRVAEGSNAHHDLKGQAITQIEEYLKQQGIAVWFLLAESNPCQNAKANITYLFKQNLGQTTAEENNLDTQGIYKFRHIKLLDRLRHIPNLIGVAGNTSGTLDIYALMGLKVHSIHTFDATSGNVYLNAQDYRILLQHSFLSIGRKLDVAGGMDDLKKWVKQNGSVHTFPLLPDRVIGIDAKKKTGITKYETYMVHNDRIAYSGALTWKKTLDNRNLAGCLQLPNVSKPLSIPFSWFKHLDDQLRAKLSNKPSANYSAPIPHVDQKKIDELQRELTFDEKEIEPPKPKGAMIANRK